MDAEGKTKNEAIENGLKELTDKIKELFKLEKIKTNDFYYVSTIEQLQKIKNCKQNIISIKKGLKEELTIDIKVDKYLAEKVFNYPDKDINLIAMECTPICGNVKLTEHEDYKWVTSDELTNFEFAPADEFIVERVKEKYI